MLGMDCLVEQREHVSLTEHGVEGTLLVKVITVVIAAATVYYLTVKHTCDGIIVQWVSGMEHTQC